MILTVTLNPTIDKTYEIGDLIDGQVNRVRSVTSIPGGKGINVARILRQFSQPVAAMGFLGGYTGRMIEERILSLGAECHFTRIKGETRTSTNVLADTGYVTEILEPGPTISERELAIFLEEYEYCLGQCNIVALCGSAPLGLPTDIYAKLITRAKKAGKKVFLDTSGELLKEGVKACPYLIKPNRKELEYLTGKKLRTREEITEEAKQLVKSGIEKVVVSLGSQGLLYVDSKQVLFKEAYKVKAVNTVSCGDSVVASLCMSELAGDSPKEALRKAAALAAANACTRESGEIPMEIYTGL